MEVIEQNEFFFHGWLNELPGPWNGCMFFKQLLGRDLVSRYVHRSMFWSMGRQWVPLLDQTRRLDDQSSQFKVLCSGE